MTAIIFIWAVLNEQKLHKILRAAALAYKPGMQAPVLKAYAEGDAARRLIEIARDNDIQIKEDEAEELLVLMKTMKINEQIPPEIYSAIARIFAFFYMKSAAKA